VFQEMQPRFRPIDWAAPFLRNLWVTITHSSKQRTMISYFYLIAIVVPSSDHGGNQISSTRSAIAFVASWHNQLVRPMRVIE
jgi:hypothetical protein